MPFSVRNLEDRSRRSFPWKRVLIALKLAQPMMRWYTSWKLRRKRERESFLLFKRTLLVIIALLAALLLLKGTAWSLVALRNAGVRTAATFAGTDLPQDEYGFSNVLLLGQGDEAGQDLIDTIIVASFDPETQSVVLLSIPRDTFFLHTQNMGKGKLNTFYRDYRGHLQWNEGLPRPEASRQALTELKDEIGRTLGLQIHHVVKVDFTAFEEIVDALGGIDVDVPEDILDTAYPDGNYGFQTFTIDAGPQHLDGVAALKYARTRSTSSDFDRSARQQQVLAAIAEKVHKKKFNATFIQEILKTLSNHVETTVTLREMITAADLATNLDARRVITMQLSDRNGLYGGPIHPGGFLYAPPRDLFEGASVLLPVSIPQFPVTWKQPRALVQLLQSARGVYLKNPTISVLNSGAKSGIARKLATELTRYGFTVGDIANANLPSKLEQSFIAPQSEELKSLADFFGDLLNINAKTPAQNVPRPLTVDLTIVLGKDFHYTPLQDLISPPLP